MAKKVGLAVQFHTCQELQAALVQRRRVSHNKPSAKLSVVLILSPPHFCYSTPLACKAGAFEILRLKIA
jgi:hypothetical protein